MSNRPPNAAEHNISQFRITERNNETDALVSVLAECHTFEQAVRFEAEAKRNEPDDGNHVRLERRSVDMSGGWEYL